MTSPALSSDEAVRLLSARYSSEAAAYARLSEGYRALEFLRQAIYLQSVHRSRARSDMDFASLHNSEEFQQMTGFGVGYVED